MKCLGILMVAAFVSIAASAAPRVEAVSVALEGNGLVKVAYNLKDEPGIVLIDVFADGEPVGEDKVIHAVGDVGRRLDVGDNKTIWWAWERDAPEIDGAKISVSVTAYSLSAPPDIMVLDLKSVNGYSFFKSESGLPGGGLTNDMYRTSKLVMKKVHAKGVKFLCGFPGASSSRLKPFLADFTYDYYLGVFEVTQAQQMLMDASPHSTCINDEEAPLRPADAVNWQDLRSSCHWPDSSTGKFDHDNITSDCLLMKFRRCGLKIDLPTDVEWEYACRAGTHTRFANGTDTESGLSRMGWYSNNAQGMTHPVGSKDSNDWGFYDMHGNVQEWTIEWFRYSEMQNRTEETKTDWFGLSAPDEPPYGISKPVRGGSIYRTWENCSSHSADNRNYNATRDNAYIGYRLCVRAEIP